MTKCAHSWSLLVTKFGRSWWQSWVTLGDNVWSLLVKSLVTLGDKVWSLLVTKLGHSWWQGLTTLGDKVWSLLVTKFVHSWWESLLTLGDKVWSLLAKVVVVELVLVKVFVGGVVAKVSWKSCWQVVCAADPPYHLDTCATLRRRPSTHIPSRRKARLRSCNRASKNFRALHSSWSGRAMQRESLDPHQSCANVR